MKKRLLTIVTLCMLGCASVVWCMKKDKDNSEYSPRGEKFAHFVKEVKRGNSLRRNVKNMNYLEDRLSKDFSNSESVESLRMKRVKESGNVEDIPSSKKVGCRCSDCYIL